jgi:hypothetical protein
MIFTDLLPVINLPIANPAPPVGVSFDVSGSSQSLVIVMDLVWYKTYDHIYGLRHFEKQGGMFFAGYKCRFCEDVYLIPEKANTENEVYDSMRHWCTGDKK